MFEKVLSSGTTVGFELDRGYYRTDANGFYREVIFIWSEDFTEQDLWDLVELAERRNSLRQV